MIIFGGYIQIFSGLFHYGKIFTKLKTAKSQPLPGDLWWVLQDDDHTSSALASTGEFQQEETLLRQTRRCQEACRRVVVFGDSSDYFARKPMS